MIQHCHHCHTTRQTCVLPCDCWPQEGKLAASEELGDLFKSASDWDTAQAIYQQAGASGKVVEALAAKGDFEQLVRRRGEKPLPNLADAALVNVARACGPSVRLCCRCAANAPTTLPRPLNQCRRSTRGPAAPRPTTCSCCRWGQSLGQRAPALGCLCIYKGPWAQGCWAEWNAQLHV